MDLKNIIGSTLNIPALELSDPVIAPCATYYQTYEETELSGNGNATEETESYEVIVWCKTRQETIDKTRVLKETISNMKYNTIPTVSFSYDTNGKVWRGNINFKHVKEE